MSNNRRFFVEVESSELNETGEIVSGDVIIQHRNKERVFVILSDGNGSGVRANIKASVIGSMALHYALLDEPVARAAQTIIHTFGSGDSKSENNATFTILDIRSNGVVNIVEFGNPLCFVIRENNDFKLNRESLDINTEYGLKQVYISKFEATTEDRIVLFSDGVELSGSFTKRLPGGWGRDGVLSLCREEIGAGMTISAYDMCRKIITRAELNDLFSPKNDMTCGVVYFRCPRRILVCTGSPYNEKKDEILADMVAQYDGTKLICGGTTSQIISRELGRDITVELKRDSAGLPPTSMMDGVDLITEGVLTLSRVKLLLERSVGGDIVQTGTDARVARMLLQHDIIEFVVGTRINPMHQDPSLPVELELRRNLIKDLAKLLEKRYLKEVKIQNI